VKQVIAPILLGWVLSGCPSAVVEDCDRDPNPDLRAAPVELSGPALAVIAHDELTVLIATDGGKAVEVPSKQWMLPLSPGQRLVGYWEAAKGVVLEEPFGVLLATPQETKKILQLTTPTAGITFGARGLYVVQTNIHDSQVSRIELISPDLQTKTLETNVMLSPPVVYPSGAGYCVQEYLRSRDGGTGVNQIRCNDTVVLQGPDNANQYYNIRASNRHVIHQNDDGVFAVRIQDRTQLRLSSPITKPGFVPPADSCGFVFAEKDGGTGRIRYWSSQSESFVLDHQLLDFQPDAVSAENKNGLYVRSGSQLYFLNAWRRP
jgi:hypothetical protein